MSDLSKFLIPITKDDAVIAPVDPNKEVELTNSTSAEWVKQEFVKEMPVLMTALMEAWKDLLKNGDSPLSPKAKAAQQVAEALGVLQAKNGVTVNTQINNNNSNNNMSAASRESLASIIRQMDKEKHEKRKNDDNIIDAELIDDEK